MTQQPAIQWNQFVPDNITTTNFGGAVQQGTIRQQTHSSLIHRHTTTVPTITQSSMVHKNVQPQVQTTTNTEYLTRPVYSTHQASRPPLGSTASLGRNSLKGTSVGDTAPQSSESHLHQREGYLQYVSSFWGRSKPSHTPPGIYNSGNICFAVSTLQALTWTPKFVELLNTVCQQKRKTVSPPSEKLQLLMSLHSVLHRCHILPDGTTSFSPISSLGFLKKISEMVPYLVAPPYSGHRQTQQDASEFLLWLLDNLEGDGSSFQSGSSKEELAVAQKNKNQCLLLVEDADSDDITSYRQPLLELAKADWQLECEKASFLTRELFLGQMVEARQCQNCKKLSVNVEYFTLLPLPIPETHSGQLSLTDCFNSFGTVERLTETNMMACSCLPAQQAGEERMEGESSGEKIEGQQKVREHVGSEVEGGGMKGEQVGGGGMKGEHVGGDKEFVLTEGMRLVMLSRLPKRLILQLSRFSYNPVRKSAQKNSTPITLPLTLDLSPFLMETKLNSDKTKSGHGSVYTLYAVCIHTGAQSTSFGHYLAYCRASNGTWYCFNDSYVSVVENIELELQDSLLLQNAYLLLYSVADDIK